MHMENFLSLKDVVNQKVIYFHGLQYDKFLRQSIFFMECLIMQHEGPLRL